MKQMHYGQIQIGDITTTGAPPDAKEVTARFVHYPDCQQLIVWLPRYGREYGDLAVVDRSNGVKVQHGPITQWLNGSVQLLFDTVSLAPGTYAIEIEHPAGFRHVIELCKLAPGEALPKPPPVPEPASPTASEPAPKIYRDGYGKVIADVASDLRARARRDLVDKFTRRIEYEGNSRSGYIHYIEGTTRFRLLHEMGGGDCKFYIEVPAAAQWEQATGTPLSRRDEIVAWIAATVQGEKASSWRYEIGADVITFR